MNEISIQSYSSDPSILSTMFLSSQCCYSPDKISFELFRVFSFPVPQISLELISDGLRVTEVSPPPFPKGDQGALTYAVYRKG